MKNSPKMNASQAISDFPFTKQNESKLPLFVDNFRNFYIFSILLDTEQFEKILGAAGHWLNRKSLVLVKDFITYLIEWPESELLDFLAAQSKRAFRIPGFNLQKGHHARTTDKGVNFIEILLVAGRTPKKII